MNLRKEPFKLDFIGNDPSWIVKTSPFHTPGRKRSVSFSVETLLPGQLLWLETPYGDYQWNVVLSEDPDDMMSLSSAATTEEVMMALERKMSHRHDLNEFFDISLVKEQNRVVVTVTAKEEEPADPVVLYSNTTPCPVLSSTSGLARTGKNGYKIAARMQYENPGNGGFTPWLFFDDNDGTVTIPATILIPCFARREIPVYNETVGAYPCTHLLMNARLCFAEFYDGIMRVVKISNWRTFVHGKIGQYEAENNIPDWKSVDNEKFYRKTGIDIFGQDNNAVVKTDVETEQFLYISNFTDQTVGSVDVIVQAVHTTGTVNTTVASITFAQGTVCRIPVGATALGLNSSTLLHYTVSVGHAGNIIRRTFMMVPRTYYARTLLLLNRVGLYESFVIDNIAVENETSGKRTSVAKCDAFVIEDAVSTITARTGRRSYGELDLLKSAAAMDGNLLLDGQYAWRITIKPGTIKIIEESEDLLEAEFSFMAVEKIDRRPMHITAVDESTTIRMNDNIIYSAER